MRVPRSGAADEWSTERAASGRRPWWGAGATVCKEALSTSACVGWNAGAYKEDGVSGNEIDPRVPASNFLEP